MPSLNSLTDLQYAAVGIGPGDISLGPTKLVERGLMEPADESQIVPQFVTANVTLFDDPNLGAIHRTRVYEVNGVKSVLQGSSAKQSRKICFRVRVEKFRFCLFQKLCLRPSKS
ncbi:MAG: hypothetical protein R3C11_20400 [Planctomycetaceae bacterium]